MSRGKFGQWLCRVLGWHLRPPVIEHAGINFNGICPRCGSTVLQDSQGNWFSVEG